MKNSIKLTALFLVLSAGLFAVGPAKASIAVVPATADIITFTSLPSEIGLAVKVEKNEPGKATVIISDSEGNVLRKDALANGGALEKDYILSQLDNGDYTIEVISNGQAIKKAIHVYDEGQTKTFIIKE